MTKGQAGAGAAAISTSARPKPATGAAVVETSGVDPTAATTTPRGQAGAAGVVILAHPAVAEAGVESARSTGADGGR